MPKQLRIIRRPLAALVIMVSLAIVAHAALNKRVPNAAEAISPGQTADGAKEASRIALVIGNGRYPDAGEALAQSVNDARALTATLRRNGFDVDIAEDAKKGDMTRAIVRLKSKVKSDSVVVLFFGGYGIGVGHENYMIPVDATIWKESDVRREAVSIESVLGAMKEQGARAELVVLDASRRNPYERRFRIFSHGLVPIDAPDNALILSSAAPGKINDDSEGRCSVLVAELLNNLNVPAADAEAVFNKTRTAILRASNGEQSPSVSSSLLERVQLTSGVGGPAKEKGG
jgi:uncharacterized caspase-like protein